MRIIKNTEAKALEKLARRAQQGDERAAKDLYNALVKKVYGFCISRVTDRTRAEDITQDIFMKLVSGLPSFDPERGTFVSWFWQLARNTLIDHFRKPREAMFVDLENETETPFEPAVTNDENHNLDMKLLFGKLEKLITALPQDDQELFHLRFVADLSYRDITELLGRPEGALRVATTRLKKKIRTHFKTEQL